MIFSVMLNKSLRHCFGKLSGRVEEGREEELLLDIEVRGSVGSEPVVDSRCIDVRRVSLLGILCDKDAFREAYSISPRSLDSDTDGDRTTIVSERFDTGMTTSIFVSLSFRRFVEVVTDDSFSPLLSFLRSSQATCPYDSWST